MIVLVLLHPQGFTDTPRGKTQIQSSLCHSQAVSQLEFDRVLQYRCYSWGWKASTFSNCHGLQIVLRATTARGFFFFVSKSLFKNYELLDQSPQPPTATHEEQPHASDNEKGLSILLIDGEAEEDYPTGTGNAIIIKLGLDRRLKQQLQNRIYLCFCLS